jgi:hypothetical protein
MTFLVTGFVHPVIASAVSRIPDSYLVPADYVITALAAADFALSFKAAIDFRNVLIRAEKARAELVELRGRMDQLQKQLTEAAALTAAAAKDKAVETAVAAKDAVAGTAAAAKDKAVETAVAAKDAVVETAAAAKDAVAETAAAAKDKAVETAAAAKDAVAETVAAAREKAAAAAAELRELKLKEQLSLTSVRALYTRSLGALLERNPGAVSFRYREVFPAVKQALTRYSARNSYAQESAGESSAEGENENAENR